MTLLIIEDNLKLARNLKKSFEIEKYIVDVAHDGESGLQKAIKHDYDAVILDLMLPKKDGFEVCKEIRKRQIQIPIIMLTALDSMGDRIRGLDSGSDDYLIKPFSFEELHARIRSLLRRGKTVSAVILKAGDLSLDPSTHEVRREGQIIPLTPKEYGLLDYFLRYPNMVLTRSQLVEHIWGPDHQPTGNELDVHIRYLRRKIDDNFKKKLIQTVKKIGYKIQT